MDNIDGSLIIKKEKVNDFKAKLRGKVSFLKESPSNVEKRFIGQKHIAGLKHFITQPLVMHDFQTAYYKEAFHKDEHGKQGLSGLPASELYEIPAVKKKGKAGFYSESKEASLFVFPDGSYGKTGFIKYIEEIKETKLEKELRKKIKKEGELSLPFFCVFSPCFYNSISQSLELLDSLVRSGSGSFTKLSIDSSIPTLLSICFASSGYSLSLAKADPYSETPSINRSCLAVRFSIPYPFSLSYFNIPMA